MNNVIKNLSCLIVITFLVSCAEKSQTEQKITTEGNTAGYDSLLAKELDADQFGMKQYVFAFLKEGPNRDQDSTEAVQLQRAHLDNIRRMAEEGKLIIAGPFMDDFETKGIYIFNVPTVEEARALTETDPAIQAGRLVMELHPWYGSAALQKTVEIHGQIALANP